jgi:protein-disulfide isomerase
MTQLRVPVNASDHILGESDAPTTLVEYGDYQCPFCAAAQPVVELLRQHFGHDLRVVFRHFPLTEIHPVAASAAEVAEFAGAQGAFWPMHESIYRNQPLLSLPVLFDLAGALNLSGIALRDALAARTYAPKVRNDFLGGVRSGVNGTPTFFINGNRHDGPYSVDALGTAIIRASDAAKSATGAGAPSAFSRSAASKITPKHH